MQLFHNVTEMIELIYVVEKCYSGRDHAWLISDVENGVVGQTQFSLHVLGQMNFLLPVSPVC